MFVLSTDGKSNSDIMNTDFNLSKTRHTDNRSHIRHACVEPRYRNVEKSYRFKY